MKLRKVKVDSISICRFKENCVNKSSEVFPDLETGYRKTYMVLEISKHSSQSVKKRG